MTAGERARPLPDESSAGLEPLLAFLRANRGFDFTGYKRTSLERRIRTRMQQVGIDTFEEYQDRLEVTPDEFAELFNTILVNVTGFFRDKAAWDYVQEEIVPAVLESARDDEAIRVWSAGCATGEEAYTLAILFAEALGPEAFRRRVKIYATDIDEDALTRARQAVFARKVLKPLPEEYISKYFEAGPLGTMFRADLRRSVIFGRNDLVQDAPISKIDLLVSRNALMYFTPEAQARILSHFNFALRETGFLFLGKSEMLITHTELFTPHNLKWRVFRKVPRHGIRNLSFVTEAGEWRRSERYSSLRAGAIDVNPVPMLLVDREGFLHAANEEARAFFGLGPADVGRPFQDLELSYKPVDLRSALAQAYETGKQVKLGRVTWARPGEPTHAFTIRITPVPGQNGSPLGVAMSFEDVTATARLEEEHERSKRRLEVAHEELQATVEELETTNEELHSTNEELETTNEELQSSNEELETMNEELQSTNDELETMNEEQRARALELDKVNLFLEGILGNLGIGVVVIDPEQRVQVWNANSRELWGLAADEAEGEHFLALDIGLPVEQLKDPVRQVLDGGEPVDETVAAVTRRGSNVACRVRILPLRRDEGQTYGVLMLTSVATDGELG